MRLPVYTQRVYFWAAHRCVAFYVVRTTTGRRLVCWWRSIKTRMTLDFVRAYVCVYVCVKTKGVNWYCMGLAAQSPLRFAPADRWPTDRCAMIHFCSLFLYVYIYMRPQGFAKKEKNKINMSLPLACVCGFMWCTRNLTFVYAPSSKLYII